MIVLDTNVVSEIVKPRPDDAVSSWTSFLPLAETALSSVTVAELFYGVEIMPDGARCRDLANRLSQFVDRLTILPFDAREARLYATIGASRRAIGRPISAFDCQIAATARAVDATIATRDVGGFADCGVKCINPWKWTT